MSQELVVRKPNPLLSETLAELGRAALVAHDRVRKCAAEAVENMVLAGEALCKARDLCDTHRFEQFIADHFRGKRRTAQTYMKLARNWPALAAAASPEALTSQRKALRILDRLLAAGEPSSEKTTPMSRQPLATAGLAAPPKANPVIETAARPAAEVADAAEDEGRMAVREMYQKALRLLAELAKALSEVTPQHYVLGYAMRRIHETRIEFEQSGRKLWGMEPTASSSRRS